MMGIPPEVVNPVIVWSVCGVLGFALGRLRLVTKRQHERKIADEAQMKALCCGMRSLLRNELVKTHRDAAARGGCSLLEKEIAERNYVAYHDLGGNGTGTAMFEEIMDAPLADDRRRTHE